MKLIKNIIAGVLFWALFLYLGAWLVELAN